MKIVYKMTSNCVPSRRALFSKLLYSFSVRSIFEAIRTSFNCKKTINRNPT